MSDATVWRWPLKQCIEIFRRSEGDPALLGIFVDFVSKLYLAQYLPESRCKIMTAVLDSLWRNVSFRLSLLGIRGRTRQIFGLNFVGQTQFDQCFDAWHKTVADSVLTL
jgi:hypothetical protein